MSLVRGIVGATLAVLMSLTTTGCIRKVLIDGQVSSTREGADAVDTLHDFEVARAVARSGLATLEGMHKLAPYNEDALYMLTRAWAGSTSAFTEDEWELAQEQKDESVTAYHLARSVAGYQRAKFFATELMERKAPGFVAAQKNYATIKEYLRRNFIKADEAPDLTWAAVAWLSLINVAKDNPVLVADMYIGVAMSERALELDEKVEHGLNHIVLGSYHARPMGEINDSKDHFEAALKINGGKLLLTQLNYGAKYYCIKSDRPNYQKMLNAVLAAGDPLPEARLSNLIAKRKARRYLDNKVFQEDCGFID